MVHAYSNPSIVFHNVIGEDIPQIKNVDEIHKKWRLETTTSVQSEPLEVIDKRSFTITNNRSIEPRNERMQTMSSTSGPTLTSQGTFSDTKVESTSIKRFLTREDWLAKEYFSYLCGKLFLSIQNVLIIFFFISN